MRAFVAGATGYTGREVVRVLTEGGHTAVAHVRPNSSSLATWRERFGALGAEVDTTPWELPAMQSALSGHEPDVVFALLGTTKARGRVAAREGNSETYESVDYGLTKVLMDAALAMSKRPRFVYLSAAGVGPAAQSPYYRARQRVEAELEESGLDYVIARPSFITGPDRDEVRAGERFAAVVADAGLAVAGVFGARRLAARYRSTSGATLAAALVRAGGDETGGRRVLESEQLR